MNQQIQAEIARQVAETLAKMTLFVQAPDPEMASGRRVPATRGRSSPRTAALVPRASARARSSRPIASASRSSASAGLARESTPLSPLETPILSSGDQLLDEIGQQLGEGSVDREPEAEEPEVGEQEVAEQVPGRRPGQRPDRSPGLRSDPKTTALTPISPSWPVEDTRVPSLANKSKGRRTSPRSTETSFSSSMR